MKWKLDIKGFLVINYLITFIILSIILNLASTSAYYIVQKYVYKDEALTYLSLKEIYNEDFNKIDLGIIEKIGGWLEILDEDKKVIFIKGQKKDNIMRYTEEQLFELVSSEEPYSLEKPYIGELAIVKGKEGQHYFLLIKYDKRKFTRTTIYNPSFYDKQDIPIVLQMRGINYLLIFLYFLIGLYIYSRISSKFITKPLGTFVSKIKKMKGLSDGERLAIGGLREFSEVENAFNHMIQKLQEVQMEKEKVNDSKKKLLVDISHDLKTPITSIQGFSRLLLEEEVTEEEQLKFLNIIYSKSVYSAVLIEDLFQLSKLEDLEYALNLTESDFCEWLKRLVAEYYVEFSNLGFNLEVNICEAPIYLKFDHNLMRRAICNILENSMIYNTAGTTVEVTCFSQGESLLLKIGDNGIGIEENIKDKIFESFVRSEAKKSKGSGLGLAITKKVIERHGGNIILSSDAKYKTLFQITIESKS